ncbi:rCG52356 [Rattus norvegicus]|uniref:RCG52356 n=1 Tax=Rattus norvegicus TaxID=10116 RepID=A6K0L9_RAT|nr:rCG52356 [Rattus norvegicus]
MYSLKKSVYIQLYTIISLFKILNFSQEFQIHYRCSKNSHSKFLGTRGGQALESLSKSAQFHWSLSKYFLKPPCKSLLLLAFFL